MAGKRQSQLLKAESFKKLHTAVADNDDYASLGCAETRMGQWAALNAQWLKHDVLRRRLDGPEKTAP